MPFFAPVPESDDRSTRGVIKCRMENCEIEPVPKGAGYRGRFLVKPTPGRVEVADAGGFVRGFFAQPGVQNGTLFVAAGNTLKSLSSAYASSTIGAIVGADTVAFDGLREKLVLRAGGELKVWDGSSFTKVTDVDAPANAKTIASVGLRLVAAESTGDGFGWSKAGLPLNWDAAGIAADFYLPDPIVSQWRQGDDLISFNASSLQRWRLAYDAGEAEALSPVVGASVSVGAISTDCPARVGDEIAFISHECVPHIIGSGGPRPIANKGVTDALLALTDTQRAAITGWSYTEGDRTVYGIRAPGLARGPCYDLMTGYWHERSTYGSSQYDVGFATTAYGETLVASPTSSKIWRLDRDVYDDDGDPIIRRLIFRVPLTELTPIDSIQFLIQCKSQPLSGQGSAPKGMLRYSRDGGQTWVQDIVREFDLPVAGIYNAKPYLTRLGSFNATYGATFELTISDPIDFAFEGILVNEERV